MNEFDELEEAIRQWRQEYDEVVAARNELREQVTSLTIAGTEMEARLHDVADERDRLRAVVDAVREFRTQYGRFWLFNIDTEDAVAAAEAQSDAWATACTLLDQLDGSEAMGDA